MESVLSQAFWVGLATIIGFNIVLSVDNAVVIALAARSLPPVQQRKAIFWGSAAAIMLRVILTVSALKLLALPWLKLIGAVVLVWIGIRLLTPESEGVNIAPSDGLMAAIKTILVADLVMSLDNVIAVAAAADGSLAILILGLAISIPLVVIGATMLLKLMQRWPIIITIGAGLIGFVAARMAITDPAIGDWVAGMFEQVDNSPRIFGANLEILCGVLGAIVVVFTGKQIAKRRIVSHSER